MQIYIHRSRDAVRTEDDYASSIRAALPEISLGKITREYNQGAFRNVMERIRSDSSVTNADLKNIIREAFGQIATGSSKAALLDQMEKEFIQQARFANKIR